MKEKEFQTKFKRSFDLYCRNNEVTGHYHKIVDCGWTNPYDCYTVTDKGFVAHELKVNRLKVTFNFYQMFGRGKQYHEILNLLQVLKTGHKAWVVIAHRKPNGYFTAYALCPHKAHEFFKRRKGVKLEEIQSCAIELDRIKNEVRRELVFDLTPLL